MSNTQATQLVKSNNPMNVKQVTTNLVSKLVSNAFSFLQTPSKPVTKLITKRTVLQDGYAVKEVEFGTLDALAALDMLNKPFSTKSQKSADPMSSGLGW